MKINVDNKTFAIGVLTLSAVILFIACINKPQPVQAGEVIKDRDYQALTARVAAGDEALYLTDNRTGMMAVFVYNPTRKTVEPMAVKPVTDAFLGGAGIRPPR